MGQVVKKSILLVTCADGLITLPSDLHEYTVHELRWPAGVLFPLLVAENFSDPDAAGRQFQSMLFAIDTLVKIKSPVQIILLQHDPCRGAEALGVTSIQVRDIHLNWARELSSIYPGIYVSVVYEAHSACGSHRTPHQKIVTELVQPHECAA